MNWTDILTAEARRNCLLHADTLARNVGLSERAVRGALRRYEAKGLVERVSTKIYINHFNQQFSPRDLEAVHRILQDGIDAVIAPLSPLRTPDSPQEERIRCGHFSQEELLADLHRCSLPAEALTRNCCWSEICRLRALNQPPIDAESWREICVTRGYLLERQNPRGF
jgi:hypothetical protein